MNNEPPASQKPGNVTAIAVMTLISGIINILWGLSFGAALALSVVLLCVAPLGLLPLVLGIFEIIYASKLLPTSPQAVRPNQTIAILEIICILFGNIFSAIAGILALVFYNDETVKAYFAKINRLSAPAPAVPAPRPIPPVQPVPPALASQVENPSSALPRPSISAAPAPVQTKSAPVESKSTTVESKSAASKPSKPAAEPKSAKPVQTAKPAPRTKKSSS